MTDTLMNAELAQELRKLVRDPRVPVEFSPLLMAAANRLEGFDRILWEREHGRENTIDKTLDATRKP